VKTTLTQFIAYLESLAASHSDIAHDPLDHCTFHRFYEAEDPQKAARNKINDLPCIMVKDYDFRFQDNGGDNLHKIREIEFMVIDKIGRSATSDDIYSVWERTEEIGDEFVIRMKDDKKARRNTAIIDFNLSAVRGVPVDFETGGLFGTSYTIPVSSVRSNDPDTNKWSDL